MRKLSMKGKRGKSDASDSESENNGVASGVARDHDESNSSEASDSQTPAGRRSGAGRKRASRSRGAAKQPDEHNDDDENGTGKEEAREEAREDAAEQENGAVGKASAAKKRKKTEAKKPEKEDVAEESEEKEYEVEKIIDQRTIKGRRQFLIRWKGYGADSDTWELEKDLNCQQLIDDYIAEKEEEDEQEKEEEKEKEKEKKKEKEKEKEEEKEKTTPKPKGKQAKGKASSKKLKKESKKEEKAEDDDENNDESDADGDPSKEYEVERIIDVHFKKNKAREFLIRWKGFAANDDTWEPEEHLNCPDLISKFMEKVEKARSSDPRELRANPMHTKRYVTQVHGKRHSRRHSDKQRVTYHHCDD